MVVSLDQNQGFLLISLDYLDHNLQGKANYLLITMYMNLLLVQLDIKYIHGIVLNIIIFIQYLVKIPFWKYHKINL